MNPGLERERQMIKLVQTDINAFGYIYEEYYDQIFNYILRRTGNVEDARDITAETFFKALKNIHCFKWRQVPFSAWLYKICTHEIASFYRNRDRNLISMEYLQSRGFDPGSEYDLEEEIMAAYNALKKHEEWLICSRAIKKMPDRYADVITLRYFAGKKIAEIAMIVGKPEGTIKSLLHRGLQKLKKAILIDKKTQPSSNRIIVNNKGAR